MQGNYTPNMPNTYATLKGKCIQIVQLIFLRQPQIPVPFPSLIPLIPQLTTKKGSDQVTNAKMNSSKTAVNIKYNQTAIKN